MRMAHVFFIVQLLALNCSVVVMAMSKQLPSRPHAARAYPVQTYYDQLYADNRLDVTIALGFEQMQSELKFPETKNKAIQIAESAAKKLADVVISYSRDSANTLRDANGIERAILNCFGCGLAKEEERVGYRQYGGTFEYGGRTIAVRVKFIFAEPGTSAQGLKQQFIAALNMDDVIIYLGHARNGRGFPDFASPLGETGFVFSNHPIEGWKGFEKGYFSRSKYQLLFLNACQTKRYYREALRSRVWEKAPSKLALVMSDDDTWFEDYPETSAALLEGLMQAKSAPALLNSINEAASFYVAMRLLDQEKKKLFVADGLFDTLYDEASTPKRQEPNESWREFPF